MENIEIVQKRQRASEKPYDDYETRCYEGRSVYTEETTETTETAQPCGQQAAAAKADAAADEASAAAEASDDSESEEQIIEKSLKDFYRSSVVRTALQCTNESNAPQRSTLWLEARRYCITASNFGAAVGHNSYMSPDQLVADKIWSCFKGNAFTAFGTFHEKDASKSLEGLLDNELQITLQNYWLSTGHTGSFKWRLHEVGLLKWHKKPWMAVSPDGILELYAAGPTAEGPTAEGAASEWILVEYKCPARQRDSDAHPYCKWPNNVPNYYMDQIQGVMGLLNDAPELLPSMNGPFNGPINGPKKCIFLVWQKHQVHISWIPFEAKYWATSLEPGLRSWYFKKYLPMAYLKSIDGLVQGTLLAGSTIVV